MMSPIITALFLASGSITYALSEVAHVLGRTGQRLYAYDGGMAQYLGLGLIILGIVSMVMKIAGGSQTQP